MKSISLSNKTTYGAAGGEVSHLDGARHPYSSLFRHPRRKPFAVANRRIRAPATEPGQQPLGFGCVSRPGRRDPLFRELWACPGLGICDGAGGA